MGEHQESLPMALPETSTAPPVTENARVNDVLQGIAEIDESSVGERFEPLRAAHDALREILNDDSPVAPEGPSDSV